MKSVDASSCRRAASVVALLCTQIRCSPPVCTLGAGPNHGTVSWNRAREAAHSRLLELLTENLVHGPRALPRVDVHVESAVHALPEHLGLDRGGTSSILTPDIVAYDATAAELLVIEATICQDAALPRYIGRKHRKYEQLCARAAPTNRTLRVGPPLVVALGTSGLVPPKTHAALARVLGGAHEQQSSMLERLVDEASAIARTRPDAPVVRERATRRQRRRRGKADSA